MFKKYLKKIDYSIIIIVLVLFAIGITALYSANGGEEGDLSEVTKQLAWFAAGVFLMMLVIFVDYDIIRQALDTNIYYFHNTPRFSTFHKAD